MFKLDVELSDEAIAFIEDQVRAGVYASPSDMITALVKDANARAALSGAEAPNGGKEHDLARGE